MSYQELNYFNKKLNVQEAMCLLEDKVNELIEVNNAEHQDHLDMMARFKEIDEFITYLQGVGLEKEVRKVMDVFVLDGTFEKLINEKVLNDINDKVDSFILTTDVKIDTYKKDTDTLVATKRDKSVLLTQTDLSTSSEAHKLTPNHLNQAVKDMMTGTTPVNPNIADGQITTEKLANLAITNSKIADGAIKSTKLDVYGVAGTNIIDPTTAFKFSQYVNTSGVLVSNAPVSVGCTDFVAIEPDKDYIVSAYNNATAAAIGCFYDSSKTFISNTSAGTLIDGNKNLSIKSPKNAKFIRVNTNDASYLTASISQPAEVNLKYLKVDGSNYAETSITNGKIADKTIKPNKISNFTDNLDVELIVAGSEIYGTYANATNGAITSGPVDVCRTDYIPVKSNESYVLYTYSTSALSAVGCIYDFNKKFIRNFDGSEISEDKLLVEMPKNAAFVIINNNRTNASKYTLKKVLKQSLPWLEIPNSDALEQNPTLTHCLDKPFNFSGKSSVWFGDSITVGVCSPNLAVSTNGYAKQVSQKIGVSFTNQAYSGSMIADCDKTAVSSENNIVNKIINYTTAKDFIFIAGGTNDWTYGVPLGVLGNSTKETFYGALQVICDSIKTNNPSAKVIFITPINQNVERPNSVDTLDKYRQAIFEVAVKNGHSVVDGSSIGFPKEQNAFSQVVCSDGVHPEQVGHDFYAKSLTGILT